jgi:hypothetical protein
VKVRSTEQRNRFMVDPGNAENSYLFRKIRGDPDITLDLMPQGCPSNPLNGATCLTGDQQEAIRTWILACAPNN